ncbi:UDP-N-acetylmuramate--L-alanine ligase [Vicingaceae bacterium]|nr:UDP-N-acetylmuramate--L-alanine ligase [Vicingaceae bacterium]MDB4060668.1 UDP-N-acetylmuramate--L-alanine ligase [Vicingaceae bacterium]MDB9964564.1 UDP-N-acetylmuramate--L-alanine ligase [Vicingaceae bacterium]
MINKENIYFIGIGGIGMSALARYFNQMGKKAAGYDRSTTTLTKQLQTEGISITDFSEADAIPHPYRDASKTLIVYTPAVSANHPMLVYFREENFECLKRAQVLGLISKEMKTIAVAGTHGKTTVSSMIAYLLKSGGVKVNGLLGGISRDFGTNLILDPEAEILVTEADEYDRSFLQLFPNQLIITSIDPDHLDIYKDGEDLKNTYNQLLAQVDDQGRLYVKPEVMKVLDIPSKIPTRTYSLDQDSTIRARNIRVEDGFFVFDFESERFSIENVKCGLPGLHNVENAMVAMAVAFTQGVDVSKIKSAIAEFQGVKRRFDVHLKTPEFVYVDDYAHHPEEVRMLLKSVKELYPGKKITTIFQPHLFSRTRDFGEDFALELSLSDDLILLEIYPAREEPIEGITSMWLSKLIGKEGVSVCEKHQLLNVLKTKEIEVLLTVGAGDIDSMIDPIINHYQIDA